jgi:hypothetical protein
MGNIIPLLLFVTAGLLFFKLAPFVSPIAAIVAAWFGVSQWGFFENEKIDQELRARTGKAGELIGFVFRKSTTALDAHAEIGLLTFEPDQLEITTEAATYFIFRDQIRDISNHINIHSLLGLGGWIVLNLTGDKPFHLESRKYGTMRQSRIRTKRLKQELISWIQEKAPA